MELESISKINPDDYCKLFRFVTFKNGWRKLLVPVFFTTIVVLLIETVILFLIAFNPAAYALIIADVSFIFLLFFLWFIAPRLNYKAAANLYSAENYFRWFDDHFSSSINSNGMTTESQFNYSNLIKVYEVKEYLFLFIAKSHIYIIPKSSFTKGSWKKLSNIIKNNIGDRYKISFKN